jgi:superfamily II DNA or RNA helicase
MIVFDEYHHYGDLAAWGKKALSLRCVFRLAMSATPYRKDEDSAFGPPDISVTYREAYEERAVKRLFCHSYVYRIDAVLPDGEIKTFTTEQLIDEAGSSSPEKIDKMCVERSMRWSPKYVSPLVDIPIARMARERLDSGLPQQVLIGAMCCSHAKLVCEQVKAMFPELRIDWVGTGPYGRPPEENKKVLQKFCPEKRDGVRSPSDVKLDVLVHVGMAGEGLDSVFVTEVVHLNEANINNTNNQENGRAARVIPGLEDAQQRARINVDSTSPYAEFDGDSIMDAMDDLEKDADADDDDTDTDSERDPYERMLPDEPKIRIFDMECIRVDHGEVERLKAAYIEAAGWGKAATEDPNHFIHGKAIDLYRQFRKREAEEFNTPAIHQQWRAAVEQARSAVVGKIIKRSIVAGARFPTSLAGDIKRKLNKKALGLFGSINESSEVPTLKKHYEWYVALESEIVTRGVPTWLQ